MKTRNKRNSRRQTTKKSVGFFKPVVLVSCIAVAGSSNALVGVNLGQIILTTMTNAMALVQQEIAEATATIGHMVKSIGTFTNNTVQNVNDNTNTMLGNLKVATAQNAQSAQALAEVQTQASQKLATARQTIHMQDMLIKAMRKYGQNGQGYKACVVVAENKGLDAAVDQAKVMAASKETETLSAVLPKSNLTATVNDKIKLANSEYCAQGNPACTPSNLPGANVNGAMLFMAANEGSKEQLARQQFRENILGVNVQSATSIAKINSPSGQKGYFESNKQAALLSPAAYSLAFIDAQNTRTIERDGKKYSANELIENTVGRYYGGAEAKEWQASMLVQEPRGLLVEAARLSGLNVWLNNYMYQQNLRKEANLAAILLSTATPLTEEVRSMGNKAEAKAIRSAASLYR